MANGIELLRKHLIEGRIGRRDFFRGAAALGPSTTAASTLLASTAQAEPKKGGRLRAGLAEGATSDSLDPQTYTDIYMISAGFATHNTLIYIIP